MPKLVNITESTPSAVQIWGFHGPCNVNDVAKALSTIALTLKGPDQTIHIMSGTHGYCKGKVGAVATREQKFAEQDRALVAPKTADGYSVNLAVHDFNTATLNEVDPITAALSKLNTDMRAIVGNNDNGKNTFLLAYCCSAGTE
ncbi:hypothetical protein [Pseudoalteromonas mariniglutinosa]|uniref:hypothetical protein n=1 Tax=Pseudoalteromonas mariniglutinosa TaxID=206042 RepID=UPI0038502816